MDEFLDSAKPPKSNKEVNHLNSTITNEEIKMVTQFLPTEKCPGPNGNTSKRYQTFKENLQTIILKSLKKKKEKSKQASSSKFLLVNID